VNHTFRGRFHLSHLTFPAGLISGYFIALFDKSHKFKFLSSITSSSSILQLFAVVLIVITARWILKDFKQHFQHFFSVYSLKLDTIKELGEKRMNEIASSKQSIEVSLQKLEKIPVQQNVQDIHQKLDQLINVLSRNANIPKNTGKPWNQKSLKQSKPAQPKSEKPKQQAPVQEQQATVVVAQRDSESWASQVV
jgi:hypothetical protein